MSEAGHVDGSDMFYKHPGRCPVYLYFRPERRWLGARRGGRYQHDRTGQERVGLHDDTVAFALLFVTDPFGEPQHKEATSAHAGSP